MAAHDVPIALSLTPQQAERLRYYVQSVKHLWPGACEFACGANSPSADFA